MSTTTKKGKDTPVKEMPKQAPSNNTDKEVAQAPQPQAKPESFTISAEGVDELVACLNDVVGSKYVKQVIFGVINEHFQPVFKK